MVLQGAASLPDLGVNPGHFLVGGYVLLGDGMDEADGVGHGKPREEIRAIWRPRLRTLRGR
jgi:hypothetical protein